VKKLDNEYSANVSGKTIETIEFEEAEAEKLDFVRQHMGLKQNREVIRALICEKCDEIKLLEEKQRKRQIEEAKAMECLEKGEYKCPM
jgi:phosphoribosylaminoimidazole carboxylase (NCAIR synthetase)